jgi:hypothetical protein
MPEQITEIIQQRYSCRSYIEKPIAGETQQLLTDFMASMRRGPFGSQARFGLVAASEQDRKSLRGLGTYGFIKGATGFIVGAIEDGEKNLEDFGYSMERIVLFATEIGLGTCWLGGTFTKSSFAKKMATKDGELVPAVVAVGYRAPKPRLVERVIRRGADAERRLAWEQLFFDGGFDAPLSRQEAGEYATPLEMVRLGPSASNQQPWRILRDGNTWHFYLQRTPGYRERTLVRLVTVADLQRIDVGIAMCHFELTARELGLGGHWEMNAPGIEKPSALTEYTASWVGRL